MNNIIDGLFTGIGVIITFSFVFTLIAGILIFLIKFLDSSHYNILYTSKKVWANLPKTTRGNISFWFFCSPKRIKEFDRCLKMGMKFNSAYVSAAEFKQKE